MVARYERIVKKISALGSVLKQPDIFCLTFDMLSA